MNLHGLHLDLGALTRGTPALAGLGLLWIGLFAALSRRRLDALSAGFFVAGLGVALLALGLGLLNGATDAGFRVARLALAVSVAQAASGLALARATAARARVTRTDRLERLHG